MIPNYFLVEVDLPHLKAFYMSALIYKRLMSTFRKFPKLSSFPEAMPADSMIQTIDVAKENKDNIVRKPRILKDGSFSWSLPESRKEYQYFTSSPQALADLGLPQDEPENEEYQSIVSGRFYNEIDFEDAGFPFPFAQAYAGWQFGQFAGQLGDGRVHNLFEVPKATRESRKFPNRLKYELQLKGSGKTPFSRFADGKAVLRSSIREYIISEHLNSIGIPTTRALSLTYLPKTYAVRHTAERCAIVSRFAELWIRCGSFDLYRCRFNIKGAHTLARYVILELFTLDNGEKFSYLKELEEARPDMFEDAKSQLGEFTDFDEMYLEVIARTASTGAMWQCYGFLNGVLNTDNTSILGLSMDFGPFSIMDRFDPKYSPNSEDHQLRYSYENTPNVLWWNLTRLGEDLAHLIGAGANLIDEPELLNGNYGKDWEALLIKRATQMIEFGSEVYKYAFIKKYVLTFFARLGLSELLVTIKNPDIENDALIVPMLLMLQKTRCDFNKFFIALHMADILSSSFDTTAFAESVLLKEVSEYDNYDRESLRDIVIEWIDIYKDYLSKSTLNRDLSAKTNPLFLPRGWILEQVVEFTENSGGKDLLYLHKLEKMAFNPFDPSKWGDELKELELKWMLQGDEADDHTMLRFGCSS